MKYCEDAKVLDALQLKDLIEKPGDRPVVNNLVFVELRVRDGNPSAIFPCYIVAWKEDETGMTDRKSGRKPLMFQGNVIQYRDGEFELLPVIIHETDFEIRKRVWDKPPVESLRKYLPFIDGIMQ